MRVLLLVLLASQVIIRNVNDPTNDTTPPTVTITTPTSLVTWAMTDATLASLTGTASDPGGIVRCTWSNSLGGSGTTTGTVSWSVSSLSMTTGDNVLTVTCTDSGGNAGTDVVTVTRGYPIQVGETFQTIIDSQSAGTTFVIKAGVHRQQTITARTADRFFGEMSGATRLTTVSGAAVLTGWTADSGRWYVTGQTQGTDLGAPGDECMAGNPRCMYPQDVFFTNVQKFHESTLAATGAGEYFFDYAADRIYVGDDPTSSTVETSITPAVFVASAADTVTIRDLIIEKYANTTGTGAVNLGYSPLGGEFWVANGLETRWNHGAGIGLDTNTTATNNYTHHNCEYGFVGAGVNVLVESNEIAYNNIRAGATTTPCGYNPYWGAGGSKFVFTTDMIVRSNFSHHNYGAGLWTDIDNIDVLYELNTIEDNTRGGIFHEISYDAIIRNNTIRRNGSLQEFPYWTTGACIEVVGSPNVSVYGNTCVDNWQGITGLCDHRGTGTYGPYTLENLQVYDNTITSIINVGGGGRTGVVETVGTTAWGAAANNDWINNDYILGTNTNYFLWEVGDIAEAAWIAIPQDVTGSFQR